MYFCCTQELEDIFEGIELDGMFVELNAEDKKTCAIARQRLLIAQYTRVLGFILQDPKSISNDCCHPESCNAEALRWLRENFDDDCYPLCIIIYWETLKLCSPCSNHAKQVMAEAKEELWQELPSFFNLSSWTALQVAQITSALS